jgi:uncharacterized OB-fold protein
MTRPFMARKGDIVTDEEVLEAFPRAPIDRDNIEYYRRLLDRELVVGRCETCGTLQYPLMPVCTACSERRIGVSPVSGNGTVYMRLRTQRLDPGVFTVPPPAVLQVDGWLTIGTIELDEQAGLHLDSLVLSDGETAPEIGDRVSLLWLERDKAPFPAFQIAAV